MKVLLVKTSSMGDLIHTLPALTDASLAIPGIQFDWIVEEAFVDIPSWHSSVQTIIPYALRRWRHTPFQRTTWNEWHDFRNNLQNRCYDLILDAQGLIKSALLTRYSHGIRAGLDKYSSSDALISHLYHRKISINLKQHGVTRMRDLFSQALDYSLPSNPPDFGLNLKMFQTQHGEEKYLVFLHGTTWQTKLWPEKYWIQLAGLASRAGYQIKIGGLTQEEIERSQRIASNNTNISIIPKTSINEMSKILVNAHAIVAVDTGLGHLAAALGAPIISLYGATDPTLTGAIGPRSIHLATDFTCAPCKKRHCIHQPKLKSPPPCFTKTTPEQVWEKMQEVLDESCRSILR
jgi:heptosyltransferase-1